MTRRWFKLHLSTTVVLMIAAGGLVFLNVSQDAERVAIGESIITDYDYAGWPFHFYSQNLQLDKSTLSFVDKGWWTNSTSLMIALADACIAIVLLIAIAFILELMICRRERGRLP